MSTIGGGYMTVNDYSLPERAVNSLFPILVLFIVAWTTAESLVAREPVWIILLPLLLFLTASFYLGRFHRLKAELREDGVIVYDFFTRRLYPWENFREAGGLHTHGSNQMHICKWIVLLKKSGIPRASCKSAYTIRNAGKLIWLPYTDAVLSRINHYYGPLDFNKAHDHDL